MASMRQVSKVPKELVGPNSPAFNKGRVHYTSASSEVRDAYTSQFAKDTVTFLHARRQEIASGGIMVLIMPGIANDIPHSRAPSGFMFDLLGFSLMDMAKEEKIGNTIGTISFLIKNSYMCASLYQLSAVTAFADLN
ncbi:hypothetical protein ACJRO7_028197 [Eucalyptus globulus]|uniref:Uncharacterized protein n=1 Tax=Eucalyptus globulus TaxID=34317 RepID=A0ABD3JWA3_EUCGL